MKRRQSETSKKDTANKVYQHKEQVVIEKEYFFHTIVNTVLYSTKLITMKKQVVKVTILKFPQMKH